MYGSTPVGAVQDGEQEANLQVEGSSEAFGDCRALLVVSQANGHVATIADDTAPAHMLGSQLATRKP